MKVLSQPSNVQCVVLYRFTDSTGLTSRLSRAPFYKRWWILLRKKLSFPYKSKLGETHSRGMVKDSPFISALEDINKGANTTDPWLRKIITGESIGQQPGEVKQAPYLYKLRVPESKIYRSQFSLSVDETEVLIQTDDLTPYIIERIPNPFLGGSL